MVGTVRGLRWRPCGARDAARLATGPKSAPRPRPNLAPSAASRCPRPPRRGRTATSSTFSALSAPRSPHRKPPWMLSCPVRCYARNAAGKDTTRPSACDVGSGQVCEEGHSERRLRAARAACGARRSATDSRAARVSGSWYQKVVSSFAPSVAWTVITLATARTRAQHRTFQRSCATPSACSSYPRRCDIISG